MYWICHKNNLTIENALKYKIPGAVFVPCRIVVSFLWILAVLVDLRYADSALDLRLGRMCNKLQQFVARITSP